MFANNRIFYFIRIEKDSPTISLFEIKCIFYFNFAKIIIRKQIYYFIFLVIERLKINIMNCFILESK